MSDKGTVFQKGGGGTNYEQAVETAFVVTMLTNGIVPCLPVDAKITEISFQTNRKGYETDDILITAKSAAIYYHLIIQVKYNLIFSCKDDVFKQVITDFWRDYINYDIFNKKTDKFLIIKSGLNNTERKYIKNLLSIAKSHPIESDFFSEINRIQIMKDKFTIFSDTLKVIDNAITETHTWEFIKCLDILDYDFLCEPSNCKLNFLNIIKLSKHNTVLLNEEEIWNTIQAFVSQNNSLGGSITIESLHKSGLFQYFDLEKIVSHYSSIVKIIDDSDILFSLFKNDINGYHIPREGYYEKILNSLQENQITFITGEPGVGKSAIVKEFFCKMFDGKKVLSFKADLFNVVNLAKFLSNQGINLSFYDLLSCILLMEFKIIFIDGMEKLLEGYPLNAFQELLNVISKYPEVKIIATARRFSIELLYQKFHINSDNSGIVFIEPLSKEELTKLSDNFPKFVPLLKNNKISALLSCPKYVEFALIALKKTNEDFFHLDSQTELKTLLWNKLVKDDLNRKDGLPKKREDAFIEIAVRRAKKMRMFIQPINVDSVAVDLLENDNIIIQDNLTGAYSPAHDILEDWALINYVSKTFDEYPSPKELFDHLGNAPAIRRGFRLWVNEKIFVNINSISTLINTTLNDSSIEKYWFDEILMSLIKSDNCDIFINEYESEMIKDDLALLKRCINFTRIASKENIFVDNKIQLLIPNGKIWEAIILFIRKNISQLDTIRMSIIGLITDWETAFILNKLNNKDITIDVMNIIIFYINQIELNNFIPLKYEEARLIYKRLFSILFNLAEISGEYITNLVKRAWEYEEKQTSYDLFSFYNIVIEHCLSGKLPPSRHIMYMPDLVIETAWRKWKLNQNEISSINKSFINRSPSNLHKVWGIQTEMSFFPAGIYKTPFYFMLRTNPVKAIKFIVAFLNYSVDFYMHSISSEFNHDITQIDLQLNDGSINKQWCKDTFWLAYRGLSVTNNLIESLLISLEKYLLECASKDTPSTQNILKLLFEYIFKNSNSIILNSILASVSIAYPQNVGESMLPILRVKEFYFFDLSRVSSECSVLSPVDIEISYAQQEKYEFDHLPHRTKYSRGLMDFVVDYQFNIKTINNKIFHIFEALKFQDDKSDKLWTKTLTEIDIRNYYIKEYDDSLGGHPLAIKYDGSLDKQIADGNAFIQGIENSSKVAKIIDDAYKTECSIIYSQWLDCYNHYLNPKTRNKLYDKYVTLAVIGLRDIEVNLTLEQKKWCIKILSQAINEIVDKEIKNVYLINYSFNILEEDIVLTSLHYFLRSTKNKNKTNKILLLFIILICNISSREHRKTLMLYIQNIICNNYTNVFNLILVCLIKYSQFLYENEEKYHLMKLNDIDKYRKEELNFILSFIKSNDNNFNTKEINFNYFNHRILCRALTIIPYKKNIEMYLPFTKNVLEKILLFLNKEKIYNKNVWNHINKETLKIDELLALYSFVADILLFSNIEISKQIIDLLLSIPLSNAIIQKEMEEFIEEIFNTVVLKLVDQMNINNDLSCNECFISFWGIWEYLFNLLRDNHLKLFSNKLLLDIPYLCYDFHGRPYKNHCDLVKGKMKLYGEIVREYGQGNLLTVINIFTNIGMSSLFPDCINWIADICKKSENEIWVLSNDISITMVKNLFYSYMADIARDENILNNYIWLLDKMIDSGISEAYYLRENVITFKSNKPS